MGTEQLEAANDGRLTVQSLISRSCSEQTSFPILAWCEGHAGDMFFGKRGNPKYVTRG